MPNEASYRCIMRKRNAPAHVGQPSKRLIANITPLGVTHHIRKCRHMSTTSVCELPARGAPFGAYVRNWHPMPPAGIKPVS